MLPEMSATWQYDAGWTGGANPKIAMDEFNKVLKDHGAWGWELVNFQCVPYTSQGTANGISDGTSDASKIVANNAGSLVKGWTLSGSFTQNFSQTYSFAVWFVFKRPSGP